MSGAEKHARLLNQWADALEELPSGPFASEDIRAAATALTTAEARIQELEAALRELEDTLTPAEQVPPKDPAYGDEVRALGLRIGFGALMASASHEWRQWLADNGYPLGSEFVAGPCRAVLESDLRTARRTLRGE